MERYTLVHVQGDPHGTFCKNSIARKRDTPPPFRCKRARVPTPESALPWSIVRSSSKGGAGKTPMTYGQTRTPYEVGPARTTFRTPHALSPLCPPGICAIASVVGAGGNGGRGPPIPPHFEFLGLITRDPLGNHCAGLSLHGFNCVIQHTRITMCHPLNVACCVLLTFTTPIPTGFFNLRPCQSPTKCGRMVPTASATRGGSDP